MGLFSKFIRSSHKKNSQSIGNELNTSQPSSLTNAMEFLSNSANEQAAAVHETISSIEQIKTMLSQTDRNIAQSLNLADQGTKICDVRLETVNKMQEAMKAIKESNELLMEFKTSLAATKNKTQIINGIVSKTQLLSFNASIEAARSGQYGKGFAVVADEIGRLAKTSGKTAKEIEDLIGTSQDRANTVVSQVITRAEEAIDVATEVINGFIETADIINQISEGLNSMSEASREQLQGMEQAMVAMEKINKFSEENRSNLSAVLEETKKSTLTPMPVEGDSNLISLVDNIALKNTQTKSYASVSDIDPDDPSFKSQ